MAGCGCFRLMLRNDTSPPPSWTVITTGTTLMTEIVTAPSVLSSIAPILQYPNSMRYNRDSAILFGSRIPTLRLR